MGPWPLGPAMAPFAEALRKSPEGRCAIRGGRLGEKGGFGGFGGLSWCEKGPCWSCGGGGRSWWGVSASAALGWLPDSSVVMVRRLLPARAGALDEKILQ